MWRSKKLAIIISYLSIFINMGISLLLTPMYLHALGIETYGLYQMIYAIASYILILDFGIGTVLIRFIAEFREKRDANREESIISYCAILSLIIITCVLILGRILDSRLESIYTNLTAGELALAHRIFQYLIVTIMLTIVERYCEGIVMANEQFSVAKLICIVKLLFKLALAILLLSGNAGILAILYADLFSTAISAGFLSVHSFYRLKCRIRLHKPEKALLASAGLFVAAFGLQSVTAYVNNSLGKTLLGAFLGKTETAVYSLSMTFITIFNMLPTAITGVFLPMATRKVVHNESSRSLTEMVVETGRVQFAVCGGFIAGFSLLGRDFIKIWAGTNINEIWLIALIIMLPNMIPLIQGMCINILDAMNRRMARSLILLAATIINMVLTYGLIKAIGIWGAPVGTAISYLVGYGVLMNMYYHKKIGLEVSYMFKGIFFGVTKAIGLAIILTSPLLLWECRSYLTFIVKGTVFTLIYTVLLYYIGINAKEKAMIRSLIPGYSR